MTHRLIPMTAERFVVYSIAAIEDYARDKVRSGQWASDEASALASAAFATLLPAGVETPGHDLFVVHDDTSGRDVGALWIAEERQAGVAIAYLYDIVIEPEQRRAGHARGALEALEREVARRGLAGIGLHVFGHNAGARALYEKLGFVTTNVNLFKPLARAG